MFVLNGLWHCLQQQQQQQGRRQPTRRGNRHIPTRPLADINELGEEEEEDVTESAPRRSVGSPLGADGTMPSSTTSPPERRKVGGTTLLGEPTSMPSRVSTNTVGAVGAE